MRLLALSLLAGHLVLAAVYAWLHRWDVVPVNPAWFFIVDRWENRVLFCLRMQGQQRCDPVAGRPSPTVDEFLGPPPTH